MNREDEDGLRQILQRLPAKDRPLWIAEANRLAGLVERYRRIRPKRKTDPLTGRKGFVPEVLALCQEARCNDAALLAKEPHRSRAPAPHTLDDWARDYRREGVAAFLRAVYTPPPARADLRRAPITPRRRPLAQHPLARLQRPETSLPRAAGAGTTPRLGRPRRVVALPAVAEPRRDRPRLLHRRGGELRSEIRPIRSARLHGPRRPASALRRPQREGRARPTARRDSEAPVADRLV